mmetsp:Transcript_34566/g.89624  ORF Transcript_34566/g.89624 Transcript_34566/m.89624 type:complete len:107 (-) Transcript_34566:665-985(-)
MYTQACTCVQCVNKGRCYGPPNLNSIIINVDEEYGRDAEKLQLRVLIVDDVRFTRLSAFLSILFCSAPFSLFLSLSFCFLHFLLTLLTCCFASLRSPSLHFSLFFL